MAAAAATPAPSQAATEREESGARRRVAERVRQPDSTRREDVHPAVQVVQPPFEIVAHDRSSLVRSCS
jgi:hypothetical protein